MLESDLNPPADSASQIHPGANQDEEARKGPLQRILSYVKFYAEQCGYAKQDIGAASS